MAELAADPGEAREELTELRLTIARKRNEETNLKLGYRRAEEGIGNIPAAALKHRLIETRSELTELEARVAALAELLGEPPA